MDVRVSTVELFFDLVFVFTITQLTSLLARDPSPIGIAQMVLVFGNVWWMYAGYAWLTNAVPPREPIFKLLLLVGMGGFLIVALAIPSAFGDGGLAFGLGYLIVTLVHTGLFVRATQQTIVRAMARLGPFNAITAALLLVAGFTGGPAKWALWLAGFVLHWITPYLIRLSDFAVQSAHFVERHGLILLITLGESVVAVGIGLGGSHLPAGRIATAVLGLALAATFWWLYFEGEDERAERALGGARADRRPWLALYAFGFGFLPILGGISMVAAGVKLAVLRSDEPVLASTAWLIAAGAAVYLLGLALFRWLLRTGPLGVRLTIAGLTLATAIIGIAVAPEVQLGVLVAILGGGAVAESFQVHG